MRWPNNKCTWLLRSHATPPKWGNWFSPIKMAAAEVNPLMTGLDRNWTKNPMRNMPMAHCVRPIMTESSSANSMYRSVPAKASPPSPAATNRLSMATGPTAKCLEVPKNP